jgi:hypothetical protein
LVGSFHQGIGIAMVADIYAFSLFTLCSIFRRPWAPLCGAAAPLTAVTGKN